MLRTTTVGIIRAESRMLDPRCEAFDYESIDGQAPCYCDRTICLCTAEDVQTGIVLHVEPVTTNKRDLTNDLPF